MSARARQSTVPRQPVHSTESEAREPRAAEMPNYDPPSYPLTATQQRALLALQRGNDLAKLHTHLSQANAVIADVAGDLNERLKARRDYMPKLRAKAEKRGEGFEHVEEMQKELDRAQIMTDAMTKKMEETTRKMIDGKYSCVMMEKSLKAVSDQAINSSQVARQTQTQTQTQRAGRASGHGAGHGGDDLPDFEPTDPAAADQPTQVPPPMSISKAFRERLENQRDEYQSRALSERYSTNNDYIAFKDSVHAGQYGEDGPPLPKASTWFNEGNEPEHGATGGGGNDGSDDDIAIAREVQSTKCPLTLQELKEPFSSKKCPHTFEKHAIEEMMKVGRTGRWKVIQCPVPGCQQHLSHNDLHVDRLTVRRIGRIQKSRQVEHDRLESSPVRDTERNGSISNGSDSGEDIGDLERRTQAPLRAEASFNRPKSTQIVDLGGESQDQDTQMEDSELVEDDSMDDES